MRTDLSKLHVRILMRKTDFRHTMIAGIVLWFLGVIGYSAERVVLAENFTNAYCSNCPLVSEILDGYLETYPTQISILRFHTSFDTNDPLYDENFCDWATTAYDVSGIPQLFLDGENLSLNDYPWDGVIDEYLVEVSPVYFNISGCFEGQAGSIVVHYEIENVLENGVYKIFVYLTEDNLEYEGSNGEVEHDQVVRGVFPSTDGVEIVDFSIGASGEISIPFELTDEMIIDNCNLVAVFQDRVSKSVKNTAQIRVSELSSSSSVNSDLWFSDNHFQLNTAYPNPFNPTTVISYQLLIASDLKLEIYDVQGKLIDTLVSQSQKPGFYSVNWNAQKFSSGVYFALLTTAYERCAQKLFYIK